MPAMHSMLMLLEMRCISIHHNFWGDPKALLEEG
jgi:hypothetical protein